VTTSFGDEIRGEIKVIAVHWHMFLHYMQTEWRPGDHIAVIGPTGEGKTTLVIPLLKQRKWVIVLDAKGEDETLEKAGFVRVTKLPLPRQIRNDIAEGKPARIIIGGASDSDDADKYLRDLMKKAIAMVRAQGGWTVYADEFQILADQRMYGLGKDIERLQVAARSKRTSVVVSYQAPAWVPKSSTRQTTWVILMSTRDIQMIKTVAEAMGRQWQDIVRMVRELPRFYCLAIPKSPLAPVMVLHPPDL
jgi:hypothetical protein